MSRSRKRPIVKDRPRNGKKSTMYWRSVRSNQNLVVRKMVSTGDYNLEIPNEKVIINDYDYSDYTIDLNGSKDQEKFSRK